MDEEKRNDKELRPTPVIHVHIQPEELDMEVPRHQAKNAGRLLTTLGMRRCTAIVARDGVLLTPDVPLFAGQSVLVRKVMSSG